MRIGHLIIGFIVFVIAEFISINVGGLLGSGPAEAGIIVSAISVLCAIVIVCTLIIVEAIEKSNQGN
jgi:hypothetical protein